MSSGILRKPQAIHRVILGFLRQGRISQDAQETATTLDKGHVRCERRTLKATTALNAYLDWPGVAQVGQIESVVEQDGKVTHETRYFITSALRELAGAGELLTWSRCHWSIKNRSHYVRDVTIGQDARRIRKGSGPEIMAGLRNAAIVFFRTTGATHIAEAIRRNASQVRMLFTKLGILKEHRDVSMTLGLWQPKGCDGRGGRSGTIRFQRTSGIRHRSSRTGEAFELARALAMGASL